MREPKPRILFVTGKLAEPALRRVVARLADTGEFEAEIAVLPITVAALLTTDWVARRLEIPHGTARVILPGLCRGDLAPIQALTSATVERGPNDLRDLPEYLGNPATTSADYGGHDIQILAEINHAHDRSPDSILAEAAQLHTDGADLIDLGCDPGSDWTSIGDTVKMLRDQGLRVSIDSFNATEVEAGLAAGAELVLSVNSSNSLLAQGWFERYGAEVVAIPDQPTDLPSLDRTIEFLQKAGVPFRVDPIIEPIGCGFAESLGRYLDVRHRYPTSPMMMGVGNLTELTDVDSAGVNVLLLGFCQELGIQSVLTTQVINWARSSVRELALARRLVFHSVKNGIPPKRIETDLVLLRDPRLIEVTDQELGELSEQVQDRNYRLFAARGEVHVINGSMYLHGKDPFLLLDEIKTRDPSLDASHAFYLGYEMAKAVTALTLGKTYVQDQALRWGFLTRPEQSRHGEC